MNYHQDEKHSTHMQHLTTSINNYSALVFFISSSFFIFTFSFFIFRFQRGQMEAAQNISIQQTLLDRRSDEETFVWKRVNYERSAL